MIKKILLILGLLVSLSACASSRDQQADSKLGLQEEISTQQADRTLQGIHQVQQQEQRKQLERQITDPVSGSLRT